MSMPAAKRAEAFAPTPSSTARQGGTNQPTDMDLTMQSNTTSQVAGATKHPYSGMDAYQLLQAAKTLVASQHLAALAFTAAQRVQADDQAALVDWAEARMESLSDELFLLLEEFGNRTDLDADDQAFLTTAIAISHDVVVGGNWQIDVRRSA